MIGIADVPLIACQSGSMADSATSSLESFHLSSTVDNGTTNPAYQSSDSFQDCNGKMSVMPKQHSVAQRSKDSQSGVYTSQMTVNLSMAGAARNQVRLSTSHMEPAAVSTASNNVDVDYSTSGGMHSGQCSADQQSSNAVMDESNLKLIDSSAGGHASKPISAQLVVTSPALGHQNSVRVPPPLPHTCTSVMSESATTSSYSDSELIPRRNSVTHNITEMVATEHQVAKQRLEVPQVFPVLFSMDISGEQFLSLFKKPSITSEQRRENRSVGESGLHRQWQRSRSADNSPHRHSVHTSARGPRRTKSGTQSRHLNHVMSSSLSQPPVLGSADLAGVTPDSMLPQNSSGFDPVTLFSVDPVLTARRSSDNSATGNNFVSENPSTLPAIFQVSANEDTINHDSEQIDDGVFDADFENNAENISAMVVDLLTVDQSASTSAGTSSEHRVPNRAILRRGSSELCFVSFLLID